MARGPTPRFWLTQYFGFAKGSRVGVVGYCVASRDGVNGHEQARYKYIRCREWARLARKELSSEAHGERTLVKSRNILQPSKGTEACQSSQSEGKFASTLTQESYRNEAETVFQNRYIWRSAPQTQQITELRPPAYGERDTGWVCILRSAR